jgi:RimJ/RimL family protein N-acetyltransferase
MAAGDLWVASTDRLVIRPWRTDEAERHYDIYRRTEVVRWLGGSPVQSRQEALDLIGRMADRHASRFGTWAIVERSSGLPVGSVLLRPLPDGDGEVEIGWHLHPDSWGKGFASEAARAVLDRGFADGLSEVWAVTYPDNARSIAVCGRLGMRLIGTTRRWYHEPLLVFWLGVHETQRPSFQPDEPGRRAEEAPRDSSAPARAGPLSQR